MRATPINELRGISDSAVLELTRNGVVTIEDLLRRDIDQIAYLLDSMETAKRMFDAAERMLRPKVAPPKTTAPEAKPEKGEKAKGGKAEAEPRPRKGLFGEALAFLGEIGRKSLEGGITGLAAEQRLHALGLVTEKGGGDAECVAALLQDVVVEQQTGVEPDEARRRFGDAVADLLEECTMIMSVPVTPVGRPQKAYVEMVGRCTGGAKMVAAAHAVATMRAARRLVDVEGDNVWSRFHGGREFGLWYYRSVRDALKGGGGALVDELTAAIDALEKATEGRAAA